MISDRSDEVASGFLEEMQRGVTALQGTGMYSKKGHAVLLSALTVTEVPHLKHLVSEIDPKAFVVVSPAHEVLGRGIRPASLLAQMGYPAGGCHGARAW